MLKTKEDIVSAEIRKFFLEVLNIENLWIDKTSNKHKYKLKVQNLEDSEKIIKYDYNKEKFFVYKNK